MIEKAIGQQYPFTSAFQNMTIHKTSEEINQRSPQFDSFVAILWFLVNRFLLLSA